MEVQRRGLSQVFLLDRDSIKRIASAVPIRGKTVLEIGAGEGILTAALAGKVGSRGRVIALELDRSLAPKLSSRLEGMKNVEVNFCDALEFDFRGFKTIFGNLPYHISSKILFKILESNFDCAVLCLQKEFAERLVALPGGSEYSRLSVMAQNAAEVEILFGIPRFCFVPIPKVDSAVVLLKSKSLGKRVKLDPLLVNMLFQHRNQSAKKAFMHSRQALGIGKKQAVLLSEGLPFKEKRVRELTLEALQTQSAWLEKKKDAGLTTLAMQ